MDADRNVPKVSSGPNPQVGNGPRGEAGPNRRPKGSDRERAATLYDQSWSLPLKMRERRAALRDARFCSDETRALLRRRLRCQDRTRGPAWGVADAL